MKLPIIQEEAGVRTHWRSAEAQAGEPIFRDQLAHPAFEGYDLEVPRADRRQFLGLMGASAALAGLVATGCIRKPKEKIMPYTRRPENLIPGKPRYFATATHFGGAVLGLLVESQEGRPTKIEGNPDHPLSLGATNVWAQAEVLGLYDPDRSTMPQKGGAKPDAVWKTALWQEIDALLRGRAQDLAKKGGAGLALVLGYKPSPTLLALLTRIKNRLPQALIAVHDDLFEGNALAGLDLVGLNAFAASLDLSRAKVIVAADADVLGLHGDAVAGARAFADGRRDPKNGMNRLYALEPSFTVTGMAADHHLALKASEIGPFVAELVATLFAEGLPVPAGAEGVAARVREVSASPERRAWLAAVATDLIKNKGRSVIAVGERQPPWVHALALVANQALGNVGAAVNLAPRRGLDFAAIERVEAAMAAGKIDTLVVSGANPAYDRPRFAELLAKVALSIHHGARADETGRRCTWHLPAAHFLEAWGDLVASDGTVSIQQPLIAPLYGAWSELELLARLAASDVVDGYELVRRQHGAAQDERAWRRWLHDGVVGAPVASGAAPAWRFTALASALAPAKPTEGLELVFALSPAVCDGRYANNGWLQELPDPASKLTWDNAVYVAPETAERLGVRSQEIATLATGGAQLTAPVMVLPGVARDTLVLALGYGRDGAGKVGNGVGVNGAALRSGWFVPGVSLTKAGGKHALASTQEYGRMEDPILGIRRTIVQEATLAEYQRDPKFAQLAPEAAAKIKSLETDHAYDKGPQWGMAIDLTACIGCNACTIACQAENNIPVVGKERVLKGREMHWIRVDRYFTGPVDDPAAVTQPVPCMHCENAPCETVCPVAATSHSPDGMNDMAYNRCIGTRYCSNNCGYKVRRFNYFNFNKENDAQNPLLAMQRNPDVTVRFRGVMEKCTYCVQRVSQAKIASKVSGQPIQDGDVVSACAQVCPTQAISFGDIRDDQSRVTKAKADERNYALLVELNTRPRTTYLAKLRNPNPELQHG